MHFLFYSFQKSNKKPSLSTTHFHYQNVALYDLFLFVSLDEKYK